jgi:hypothetical protein
MATTTPNFGWAVPTSSDLVKNGATAIETLGDSIDASLVDLKGGTTGQVLAKATGTDMDFTWTTPSSGSAYVSGNNFIINGGLDIWQRGTSFTGTAPYYNADRWNGARAGAAAGATWSQQTIAGNLGTTPPQGVLYSLRVARDSGNTSTAIIETANGLDSNNSIPLAGQTVVVSFYAKAGANFSSASNALAVKLVTGTGINQNYLIASYTGLANAISTTATLTTSWQRFQYTATLPTTATEVAVAFAYTPVGTAGAADNFEITGLQLEIGSVATQFGRAGGSYGGELSLCQRYYWRSTPNTGLGMYGLGMAGNSTQALVSLKLPVTMRVIPTSIDVPSTITWLKLTNYTTTNWTISAIALLDSTFDNLMLYVTSSSMTANQGLILGNNNSGGFIGASAEL